MPSIADRGQPQFAGTDVVSIGQYLSMASTYAAVVGNRMVDTSSHRTAFSSYFAFNPWRGLDYYESDTDYLYRYDGSSWKVRDSPWTLINPTFGGISAGGGASNFRIRYTGGEIEMAGYIVLGSSGFVNGDITVTVPVAMSPLSYYDVLGTCMFRDASPAVDYPGVVGINGNVLFFRTSQNNGSNKTVQGVASSSNPFTWAPGDSFNFRVRATPV